MDITHLGHSSFKIKTKTATVITDPFDPVMVGLKYPTTEGDVVTVSHDHHDHNAVEKVTGAKKVFSGPGEYEVMGVSIIGFPSFHDQEKGQKRGKNTIFVFEADGLRLAHLGDLGHTLSEDLVGQIGDIDILFVPCGGEFTIGSKDAATVVSQIDPFFIIPMHYKSTGLKEETFSKLETLDPFLKETGLSVENLPKLSIKMEDIIEDQSAKVVVLSAK